MKNDIVHGEKLGGTIEGYSQEIVISDLIVWRGTSI